MKRKASFLCPLNLLLLFLLIFVSCSKNGDSESPTLEFKINSEVNEYGAPYYKVGGNGGNLNFSFTTNTSWYFQINSYDGINLDISQLNGKQGTNNITIRVDKNSSSTVKKIATITLYTIEDKWLAQITIEQNPYPIMEVEKQNIIIEQLDGQASINVKSNVDYELVVPNECANWLSATKENNKVNIICTDTDRKGIIIIKADDISQEIEVIQKGGIYLNSQIVMLGSTNESISSSGVFVRDDGVSGTIYKLPPTSGEYALEITTNLDFELKLEDNIWLTNLQLNKKNDNSYSYNFNIKAQDSEADGSRKVLFTIKYSNGDMSHSIMIEQRDWWVTVYVNKDKSLSKKLDEIEDGYKLKSLHINGGILDCNYLDQSLKTVQEIVIKDVETIPDYFCYSITSLKTLNLENVKKIGTAAFDFCTSLATIYLPSSLEYIGDYAFYKTNESRTVYAYMSRPCRLGGKNSWGRGDWNGTLYVPLGSLNYYKSENDWYMAFARVKESSNIK